MDMPAPAEPTEVAIPICHPWKCGCPDCHEGRIYDAHYYAPGPRSERFGAQVLSRLDMEAVERALAPVTALFPYEMVTVAPMASGDLGVPATNTAMNVIDYGQYQSWPLAQCKCATDGPYDCLVHGWMMPRSPEPARLSDEDVRRIAREVVRQLARAGHDPGDEDGGSL